MQKNNTKVFINDLVEVLNSFLLKSVKVNQPLSKITSGKTLVLKSVRDSTFVDFLEMFKKNNLKFEGYILGEIKDEILLEKYNLSKNNIFYHGGKFLEENENAYLDFLPKDFDRILFLNYTLNSDTYLNVEKICSFLSNTNGKVPVWSFSFSEDSLNEFLDIDLHIDTIELYTRSLQFVEKHLIGKD